MGVVFWRNYITTACPSESDDEHTSDNSGFKSSSSEDVTNVETSITDNLAGGDRDDWTTVDIFPHLELREGNADIEVIPNDSKAIKEVTSMIFSDNFYVM
jgi:hypothetical protein